MSRSENGSSFDQRPKAFKDLSMETNGAVFRADGSRVITTVTDMSMFDGNKRIAQTRERTWPNVRRLGA